MVLPPPCLVLSIVFFVGLVWCITQGLCVIWKGPSMCFELDELSVSGGLISCHTKTHKYQGAYIWSWLRPCWCDTDTCFVMPVHLFSIIWKGSSAKNSLSKVTVKIKHFEDRASNIKNIFCLVKSRFFHCILESVLPWKTKKVPWLCNTLWANTLWPT